MDLTAEEESALRELVSVHESGRDVAEFISDRLYSELSYVVAVDNFNNEIRDYEPGFELQRQIYDGLAEKGMIDSVYYPHSKAWRHRGLTSAGRCYFRDRDERERVRLAEREDDRRYARRTAIIGATVGLIGSLLINLPSLVGLVAWVIELLPAS